MGGDLLKKSRCLTKEKLTFPDYVDNISANTFNAAKIVSLCLKLFYFLIKALYYVDF